MARDPGRADDGGWCRPAWMSPNSPPGVGQQVEAAIPVMLWCVRERCVPRAAVGTVRTKVATPGVKAKAHSFPPASPTSTPGPWLMPIPAPVPPVGPGCEELWFPLRYKQERVPARGGFTGLNEAATPGCWAQWVAFLLPQALWGQNGLSTAPAQRKAACMAGILISKPQCLPAPRPV